MSLYIEIMTVMTRLYKTTSFVSQISGISLIRRYSPRPSTVACHPSILVSHVSQEGDRSCREINVGSTYQGDFEIVERWIE